jgi:hypothetical protein
LGIIAADSGYRRGGRRFCHLQEIQEIKIQFEALPLFAGSCLKPRISAKLHL